MILVKAGLKTDKKSVRGRRRDVAKRHQCLPDTRPQNGIRLVTLKEEYQEFFKFSCTLQVISVVKA
jgi:hypothetical protein